MSNFIEQHLRAAARTTESLVTQQGAIEAIANKLVEVARSGGTIFACGNGGSACDAMHLAEELVARYKRERPGIRAQHLCDAGVLTCWSNDYSYQDVFRRQVETFMTPRDALVCFSTSGNSENVLRALTAAKGRGAVRIGLLGKGGGKALELCDQAIVVPSDVTAHVQEAHIVVLHILCEILENKLFPPS